MKLAVLVILLALFWAVITANFGGANLVFGAILALLGLLVFRRVTGAPSGLGRFWAALVLAAAFAHELLASAIRVGILVLTPNLNGTLRPAIVAVPLTLTSDLQITLLANLITLTPGTLSIDVSDDKSVLYVHALMVEDRKALMSEIASGFERQIKAVFA